MHRLHRKGFCWRLWLWRRNRRHRCWSALTPAQQRQEAERIDADIRALLAKYDAREAKRNEPLPFPVQLRNARWKVALARFFLAVGILTVVGVALRLPATLRHYHEWPDLLPVLTAAVIGILAVAASWLGLPILRRTYAQMRQFPDAPWRHYGQWQLRRMCAMPVRISACALLLLGLAILVPVLLMLITATYQDWDSAMPLVAFGLAGFAIVAIVAAWEFFVYWRRYGEPELEFVTFPGLIGRSFLAALHVRGRVITGETLTIRLANRDVNDSARPIPYREIWHAEYTVAGEEMKTDRNLTVVPVAFRIPAEARPVYKKKRIGESVDWELQIRGDGQGHYFFATFKVPVFTATPEQATIIMAEARDRLHALPHLAAFAAKRNVNLS